MFLSRQLSFPSLESRPPSSSEEKFKRKKFNKLTEVEQELQQLSNVGKIINIQQEYEANQYPRIDFSETISWKNVTDFIRCNNSQSVLVRNASRINNLQKLKLKKELLKAKSFYEKEPPEIEMYKQKSIRRKSCYCSQCGILNEKQQSMNNPVEVGMLRKIRLADLFLSKISSLKKSHPNWRIKNIQNLLDKINAYRLRDEHELSFEYSESQNNSPIETMRKRKPTDQNKLEFELPKRLLRVPDKSEQLIKIMHIQKRQSRILLESQFRKIGKNSKSSKILGESLDLQQQTLPLSKHLSLEKKKTKEKSQFDKTKRENDNSLIRSYQNKNMKYIRFKTESSVILAANERIKKMNCQNLSSIRDQQILKNYVLNPLKFRRWKSDKTSYLSLY